MKSKASSPLLKTSLFWSLHEEPGPRLRHTARIIGLAFELGSAAGSDEPDVVVLGRRASTLTVRLALPSREETGGDRTGRQRRWCGMTKEFEHLTGETPNITELCQFHWYGLVYFWNENNFPDNREKLGRFLGVAHNVESAMCYYVLPAQPKTGEMKVLAHTVDVRWRRFEIL